LILWAVVLRPEIRAAKSLPEILVEFERHANYPEGLSKTTRDLLGLALLGILLLPRISLQLSIIAWVE